MRVTVKDYSGSIEIKNKSIGLNVYDTNNYGSSGFLVGE